MLAGPRSAVLRALTNIHYQSPSLGLIINNTAFNVTAEIALNELLQFSSVLNLDLLHQFCILHL